MRPQIAMLKDAHIVQILLHPTGGYKGSIDVVISDLKEQEFNADLELADWTRFPARIRAAATELRDQGYSGVFKISHDEGRLQIEIIHLTVEARGTGGRTGR
jgi:hypothetical protein